MSGAYRTTVIFLAIAAVALGIYDVANPYRAGMVGFDIRTLNNGNHVVTNVYPGSPADRAGIRAGDQVLRTSRSPGESLEAYYRRAGQALDVPVLRNGKVLHLHMVTAAYSSKKPVEEGPLELVILMIFAGTGILVALRGSARRESYLLALFFTTYSASMATWWFADVAPTPVLTLLGWLGQLITGGATNFFLLLFVAAFPPITSRLRTVVKRAALPIILLVVLVEFWGVAADIVPQAQFFEIAGSHGPDWLAQLIWVFVDLLLVGMALEGLMRVDDDHRAQMRWVGVAVIVSSFTWLVFSAVTLTGPNQPGWFAWMSLFVDIPLLAIAYAVLRHRLVDLSIVVSRAATFGFVSIFIVALFVALEWAAAEILGRTVGDAAANGLAGQALRLTIALIVGLSVRPVHATVERYLNGVFFAKRSAGLAALRRFAGEADVVTNSASLLTLTLQSLREDIEGRYAAIYLFEDGMYQRLRSSSGDLPLALDENDAAVVRLRRWNESFEMDLGPHPLSEALLVPMTVRGAVLGFFVCGPKRERTHHLADEIDAIELVAHRVATAYVLLQQESVRPGPLLAPA